MEASNTGGRTKTNATAGVLLAGAVALLALPSAVLAFTAKFDPSPAGQSIDSLGSDDASATLARPIPVRSLAKGQLYPFTPADTPNRPDRSVTVAVRVDADTAKAISARAAGPVGGMTGEGGELRIAPTAFNLGMSRGYAKFGQNLVPETGKSENKLPNLEQFSISPAKGGEEPRFSPRIVMDEAQTTGRAPRTFAGAADDTVDVGGSYRVTRNLDVTAGVRYSQERERLLPPVTDGKQDDSQAVYVGTQFRF